MEFYFSIFFTYIQSKILAFNDFDIFLIVSIYMLLVDHLEVFAYSIINEKYKW